MKLPRIIPRSKMILVQPDDEKSRESKGGILIPGNVEQEQKTIGTVLAADTDIKDVKKGDRVIFGTYAGDKVKLRGEGGKEVTYFLLHDEDVLAFIEDK